MRLVDLLVQVRVLLHHGEAVHGLRQPDQAEGVRDALHRDDLHRDLDLQQVDARLRRQRPFQRLRHQGQPEVVEVSLQLRSREPGRAQHLHQGPLLHVHRVGREDVALVLHRERRRTLGPLHRTQHRHFL